MVLIKERKFLRLCLYRIEQEQVKKTMLLCWRWNPTTLTSAIAVAHAAKLHGYIPFISIFFLILSLSQVEAFPV
jgi:hypothetical protein